METLVIHDQSLELLPEKAAHLPDQKALLISDVHLGKSETFQRFGIPISSQVNQATLNRLRQACDRTGAQQLFILGDLFHAKVGMVDEVIDSWLKFLAETQLEAHLILGNHDRGLLDFLSQLSVTCYTTPIDFGPWVLSHEPLPMSSGVNICGHIHPCVRIGRGSDRLRLPCFYWEKQLNRLTLPSFGEFTGGYDVAIGHHATAYVVAEDVVTPFG
ncbi:ligase-associated DNA damage response endonuclease PdeM [Oscillatoria sp. CS-180]|uniref:ligase-associated DNA damage response endonuclease PdeM n=1 Tax=Oscillatoria sp. CS-180 TaxID=3021720 RepID=UPI00232D7CD7|nr:ligase-associated DNA damage response endonuclease PdeM [Oscillatoria sp. CS-180]